MTKASMIEIIKSQYEETLIDWRDARKLFGKGSEMEKRAWQRHFQMAVIMDELGLR